MTDLLAVLDAAAEPSAVLVGHSMGVQVCLEAHRRAPDRVAALVLVAGAPGRLLDTFHGRPWLAELFPWFHAAVLACPWLARWGFRALVPTEFALQIGRLFEVNRERLARKDLRAYLEDVADVDPEVFVRMLASAARHDASDHLARVDVPTLVVAGRRDTWTPFALSRRMHEAIPGAELLELAEGTHTGLLEYPDRVARRVERFLADRLSRGRGAFRRGSGAPAPPASRRRPGTGR